MKVVILAGGYGTRISEESAVRPKPMVEIGDAPILWHIMKYYSHYGFNDFIICLGYKGYIIKEYFNNYYLHMSDITFDFTNNENNMIIHNNVAEPWKITLVETGLNTMTGGRLLGVRSHIGDGTFMMTYGDGVSNVNISELISYHKKSGGYATITAVHPEGRFGSLEFDNDERVTGFKEKTVERAGWINGGFMVLEQQVFDYLVDERTIFEQAPLQKLANEGKLNAYRHSGFWMPMDTLRDKNTLEKLWNEGNAPWKVW